MRVALVCNPVSGKGRARRIAPGIESILRSAGATTDVYWTRGRGDATAWARAESGGYDRIAIVGGDGTLNELINGLPEPLETPIGHLAMGNANLLAHDLRLPRDPKSFAKMIEAGKTRRIDMAVAGERRFILVLSAGFDAMVTRDIAQTRTSTINNLGYARPILRVLRGYLPPRLSVEVDDHPGVEGQLVIVSNTRNYGGLFTMADLAHCDSGHLDACVLRDASLAGLVRTGVAGLTGGLSAREDVTYLSGRRIRIRSEDDVPIEIDGDYAGTTPVDIEVRPAAVPIIVPG